MGNKGEVPFSIRPSDIQSLRFGDLVRIISNSPTALFFPQRAAYPFLAILHYRNMLIHII